MHFFTDGEKLFGLAAEYLLISLPFWQPSAITLEAMGIDACQVPGPGKKCAVAIALRIAYYDNHA